METLTIGQVAKQAGVNVETVRYYERQGLIPEPPRQASGYRQYNPDFVKRIQFIKRAQSLGFSLKEISELLALRVVSDIACDDVKQHAEKKMADIEKKIQSLERIKTALAELVTCCERREQSSDCPILEVLEPGNNRSP